MEVLLKAKILKSVLLQSPSHAEQEPAIQRLLPRLRELIGTAALYFIMGGIKGGELLCVSGGVSLTPTIVAGLAL